MRRAKTLRKNSEFTTVYTQGKSWAGDLVVLKALPNGLEWNRYGIVAGKRVGNAVARNRTKRLLREIARSTPTRQGWDIILIARARAASASHDELDVAVKKLFRRADMLEDLRLTGRREEVRV
jgi:ribonuclease P protein component